jgi:RNA polymerase sigma factor (sigma-70 family)
MNPITKPGFNWKGKMYAYEDIKTGSDWQRLLYDRYHQKVLGICVYFLKDREEAQDATHDVFIKAFRAWGDFEWKCDPLTWIGAIAKHDCFTRMQKVRKHREKQLEILMENTTSNSNDGEEEMVIHRLRLEKILPSVKGKLKEILHLSLEQGLNHREIANHMGVSRVAITRRLTRFKREIQHIKNENALTFTVEKMQRKDQKTALNSKLNFNPRVEPGLEQSRISETETQLQAA